MVRLEPFQQTALGQLHSGCILAGTVGSGKSIVSIMWYLTNCICQEGKSRNGTTYMPCKGSPNLLIITEAKKRDKDEWGDDLVKFGLHVGVNKPSGIDITVDSWQRIRSYEDFKDGIVIFDEQHATGTGVWSKSFIKIAKQNRWILLSATPADTYEDLIPIFVANGFYRNKTEFMRIHAVYDRWAKFPKVKDWLHKDRLNYLRRKIMVPMERPAEKRADRKAYQIIVDYDKDMVRNLNRTRTDPWSGEPIENISQFCFAMRKVVNSDRSRMREIVDICVHHPRVIIFYNYDFELEMLLTLHEKTGLPVYQYNGHRHDEIPDEGDWIYLVNYSSGAAGWNCTKTDTMIFYSLNYSYRIMEQAAGRIDRLNTPFKELNYYVLRSYSKIEMSIVRALAHKETFNESAFGRRNGW